MGGCRADQAAGRGHEPGPFFDLCVRGKKAFDSIVERLTHQSGIDPEYDQDGVLYVAFTEEQRAELSARARWQLDAGAPVEVLTPADARKLEPALSAEIIYALHLPTNRRLENRKLTQAYISAALKAGATFREGARVDAIVAGARATGVRTADGAIDEADVIVNAAGSWAGEIRGLESDGINFRPVRGQIVCFETRPGPDRSVVVLERRYPGAAPRRAPARGLGVRGGGLQQERDAGRNNARIERAGWFRRVGSAAKLGGAGENDAMKAMDSEQPVKALGLVRDLFFRARIDAVARATGADVSYASTLDSALGQCAEGSFAMIFADLSDASLATLDTVARLRAAAPHARLIGFASHVDLKALRSARDAGFDQTLSREQFTARLPELLSSDRSS